MEHYGPLMPHESGQNTPEKKPRKKGRLEVFSEKVKDILKFNDATLDDHDTETDDSQPEKATKRKRRTIGKYIAGLFAGNRQPPESRNEEQPIGEEVPRRFIPLGIELGAANDAAEINDENAAENDDPSKKTNPLDSSNLGKESSATQDPTNLESLPALHEDGEDEEADDATTAPFNQNDVSILPPPPEANNDVPDEPASAAEFDDSGGGGNYIPPTAKVAGNVVNQATPNQVNVTNIENRPAWGPALVVGGVVDQLARRRDRVQKRELRQQADELGKLRKEQEEYITQQTHEQRIQQQQTEQTKKQFERQLHSVAEAPTVKQEIPNNPMDRPATEAPKTSFMDRITAQETGVARGAQPVVERSPHILPAAEKQKTVERPVMSPQPEKINPKEYFRPELKETSSQIMLDQVEAAAEHNIPLEGLYERSHEVKDVATTQHDDPAHSQPHLVGRLFSNTDSADSSVTTGRPNSSHQSKKAEGMTQGQHNKTAENGILIAIALIILVMLFMILR